ncbi:MULTISPECIES: hypothetical protein [Gordonia]|uniref:hypothetical protein n=1 Tax=Gordonia TaxID=2053 RepID=UPI003266E6B8
MIGFVDESKARGLLVACTVAGPHDVVAARRVLTDLRMRGQRRLHFKSESDSRRRLICSSLVTLPVTVRIYQTGGKADRSSRGRALDAVVRDLAAVGGTRLVIERDESLVQADRAALFQSVRAHGVPELRYEHPRAHEEPMLWVSDAVAWCYGKGGAWRARVEPLVEGVTLI